MKSTQQKVMQLEGLLGTKDLTAWEHDFVQSIVERGPPYSDKQTDVIERIWQKHFA